MTPRRLPVLQSNTAAESVGPRPAWQWLPLGIGLIVTLWLPLAVASLWLVSVCSRLLGQHRGDASSQVAAVAPIPISYALACFLGGLVLRHASPRMSSVAAALVGAATGTIACAIALFGGSLQPWPVALAAWIALAPAGALFTTLGLRARR